MDLIQNINSIIHKMITNTIYNIKNKQILHLKLNNYKNFLLKLHLLQFNKLQMN